MSGDLEKMCCKWLRTENMDAIPEPFNQEHILYTTSASLDFVVLARVLGVSEYDDNLSWEVRFMANNPKQRHTPSLLTVKKEVEFKLKSTLHKPLAKVIFNLQTDE